MAAVGIVCEYNPFHLGHEKQLRMARERLGANTPVVCLMSGNFVQRGAPALFDKTVRARAAVECGASLVLELPVTCALSSAEGFARGAVEIFDRLGAVDTLCFGSETGDAAALVRAAEAMTAPAFTQALRLALTDGLSYPAAQQRALEETLGDGALLTSPNDILAAEYCKALFERRSRIRPLAVRREGGYHDETPDAENPSATRFCGARAGGSSSRRPQPPSMPVRRATRSHPASAPCSHGCAACRRQNGQSSRSAPRGFGVSSEGPCRRSVPSRRSSAPPNRGAIPGRDFKGC